MATFLCLQRSLPTGDDASAEPMSPAQMQEMYAAFGAWQQRFADQLVDLGGKVGDGTVVATTDGPFVEVKELVGGYMVVEADTLEGAIEVASACPGLVRPGSGVEILAIHRP